jgi:hypothetical protein
MDMLKTDLTLDLLFLEESNDGARRGQEFD